MFELPEAMELAFIDLEESYICSWRMGKGSRDSIIKAFSQRDVPAYKFLGFAGSDGLRHAFGRAIPDNNKPTSNNKKWEDWVLERIGLYYCAICGRVHESSIDEECLSPTIDRSQGREGTSIELCNYLLRNPCIICGETDIRVLEFDHVTPETKSFNIGDRSNRTWPTLLKEIEKCRVLCANCHRRHTAESYNHFKHQFFTNLL